MGLKYTKVELKAVDDLDRALLVLVRTHHTDKGITAYDIVRLIKEGKAGLLGRAPASVYTHLRGLADGGFLSAEQVPGKRGRSATKYALTRKGNEALLVWLDTSVAKLAPLDDSEAFLRIRATRVVGSDKLIWKGLEPMVWEIAERRRELDAEELSLRKEGTWAVNPPVRLEIQLMRALLDAYMYWLDEVRREFGIPDPFADD